MAESSSSETLKQHEFSVPVSPRGGALSGDRAGLSGDLHRLPLPSTALCLVN